MPVADLSLVTRSLARLIEFNVENLVGSSPNVTTVPPETLENQNENLNLYLFHVAENPNWRAEPPFGQAPTPIATTPLSLQLFYIVTAQHQNQTVHDTEVEQRLLGAAMKTLHDFPVLDDSSRAGPLDQLVFEPGLRNAGNRLQTVIRPITPEEAINFWTAEQARTVRLSLYCEVGWVFLDAEPPALRPGIVLSVGNYVSPIAGLTLTGSESALAFTPPAASGVGPQVLAAQPARPSLEPAAAPADSGLFELQGSNLTAGERPRVVLRNPRWSTLTPPQNEISVDLALNATNGWEASFEPERVVVRVGQRLSFRPDGGALTTIDVFPGAYLAAVETVVGIKTTGVSTTDLTQRSNFVPVLVAPRIVSNGPPGVQDRITIELSPSFDITHGAGNLAERLDVALTVDGVAYERVAAFAAGDNDGRFVVSFDAGGPSTRIEFEPAFDAGIAGVHPTQVTVEGVDAQPWWIELP